MSPNPIPTVPGHNTTADLPLTLKRSGASGGTGTRVVARQRVLVLGATSGIAEASIRIWASRGEDLFLVGRNAERLAAVAADARVRGAGFVETAVADLDQTQQHAELMAHAINSLGGLDVAYLAVGVLGNQSKVPRWCIPTLSLP